MMTDVFRRPVTWRGLMWAGIIGSVLTSTLAWYLGRGPWAMMVLFALVAVALGFRASAGVRWALVGVTVAGFVLFLASVYWLILMYVASATPVGITDVLTGAAMPMVAAMVLLTGSLAGLRRQS